MTQVDPVRGLLDRNRKLKAAALGLSILLWMLVRFDASTPEDLSVPVEISLLDDGWAVVSGPDPARVDVRFAGPVAEIVALAARGPSIVLPIENVSTSDTVIFLRREWVDLGTSTGLTILEMEPQSVRLAFQQQQDMSFPVALRFTSMLREGLALSAPVGLNPSTIQVRGPTGLLAARDSLYLVPFDLSRVRMTDTVELAVDTTALAGMTLADSVVRVSFAIEPAVSAVVGDVPVALNGLPEATDLEGDPATVIVELTGAESIIDAIDTSMVTARVDISGLADLAPGASRTLPVQVRGVPDLIDVMVDPPSIRVRRIERR